MKIIINWGADYYCKATYLIKKTLSMYNSQKLLLNKEIKELTIILRY